MAALSLGHVILPTGHYLTYPKPIGVTFYIQSYHTYRNMLTTSCLAVKAIFAWYSTSNNSYSTRA